MFMVIAVIAYFLGGGFILTRDAPNQIRGILWILLAGLIFPLLLLGILLRRTIHKENATGPIIRTNLRLRTRIVAYFVSASVTAVSAAEQVRVNLAKKLLAAAAGEIFLWNFAALVALIAICEFIAWRMRRAANQQ
jgi:hypothetical protein